MLGLNSNASHHANILEADDQIDSGIGSAQQSIVYVGTFKREPSKGIYAWRFDGSTAKMDSLGLVADAMRPIFIVLHPNHKFLYAVV